jgi:signal transduction histidine kinase
MVAAAFDLPGAEASQGWRTVPLREGIDRILLVDDSPDMLRFLVDQLSDAYNISLAGNGEEGLARAKSEHPDLILSDIVMPVKDGYQLCRELKEDPQTSTIPIILLTAKGSLSDKIEGLEQGADDYLTKPFSQEELRVRVVSLLQKRRLQKEISDRNQRLEEQTQVLAQKNAEIEAARRVLEAKAEALARSNVDLSAFSYSVSHDLQAPLRAIEGFAGILVEEHAGRMDPDGLQYLDVIRRNIKQMNQLIEDLLNFSRLGQQNLTAQAVDMDGLARSVVDELKFAMPHRTPHVTVHSLAPALGDRALLYQVWLNLISNAVKYTRPRSIPLIEVGGNQEGNHNRYYVKDNGVGFDMRFADQLFKVFQRLHSAKEFEGTGVGLALVERLIHRHGGRVWAEGKLNEGATFYFTLPSDRSAKAA